MIDGLFLNRILEQLSPALCGSKINRIFQPDSHTVTFKLKTQDFGNRVLLLSSHPKDARIHFTESDYENPKQPPLFVMVLRKHLEGGRITGVAQYGLDRVAEIYFEAYSEIGEQEQFTLYLEIMGKHSNIILCNRENIILAAIKQYGSSTSRYRRVLPGEPYIYPPASGKHNPYLLSEEEFTALIMEQEDTDSFSKAILNTIEGVSPNTVKEIIFRSGINLGMEKDGGEITKDEAGLNEYRRLYQSLKDITACAPEPSLMKEQGLYRDVYYIPYLHMDESIPSPSLDTLLDDFFYLRENQEAFLSRRSNLLRILTSQRDKAKKTVEKQEKELEDAMNGEKYRIKGELLSANLYRIEPYSREVTLENFYDDNKPVTIALNPDITPAENASLCFKKYTKKKNARSSIRQQLDKTRDYLEYLESLCFQCGEAENDDDLAITSLEMTKIGLLKQPKSGKKPAAPIQSSPIIREYMGYTISIGRNNKQNDKLTLKTAQKNDLWFHTKNIPGSHVIVSRKNGEDIPEEVIYRAAQYAAGHSRAAESPKVPVDYTEVRQVKKPNGARPGMVIYFEQTTIMAEPLK